MPIDRKYVRKLVYGNMPRPVYFAQLVWRRAPLWRTAGAIFIHIPKNGGTSINTALYGQFMGHFTTAQVEKWAPRTFASLPSFAITRNPWDRVFSAYRFARAGQAVDAPPNVQMRHPEKYRTPMFDTFEHFVNEWIPDRDLLLEDHVFRPQHSYVTDKSGSVAVSFLGQIERLEEVTEYLQDTLNRRIEIGHINRTKHSGDYRDAYTPEMRKVVAKAFATDIDRFGYDF